MIKYLILSLSLFSIQVFAQELTTLKQDVNIRLHPSTRAALVESLSAGTSVKVLETTPYRQSIWIDQVQHHHQWAYVALYSNPEIKGWVYAYYLDIRSPQFRKIAELTKGEIYLLKPQVRTNIPRNFKRNFKNNNKELEQIAYPQNVHFSVQNDSLMGYIGQYAILGNDDYERMYGKLLRALRFKNITDVVEDRYNLPSGILLAMIMQESSGEPLLLNGRDDGGAGLAHMQPDIAKSFSLETYNDASGMVNQKHGRELRELVKNTQRYLAPPMQMDDRLNWLKNIDAVGRMLATYMSAGANSKYGGVLESMIARYSGAVNFKSYFRDINVYMLLLNQELSYQILDYQFRKDNPNLLINGKSGTYTMLDYLQAYWKLNASLFQLNEYKKLKAYAPYHSYELLLNLPAEWQKPSL